MHKVIISLFVFGIVLCIAGHKYQSRQQARQISWQDVNVAMQDVESAKRELFQSLNAKTSNQ